VVEIAGGEWIRPRKKIKSKHVEDLGIWEERLDRWKTHYSLARCVDISTSFIDWIHM